MKEIMRFIDYREIRKLFGEQYKQTKRLIQEGETHLDNLAEGFTEADHIIRDLPDVDAVEVVRCKDCQHYIDGHCYVKNRKPFSYDVNIHSCKENDFCSYGERKEQE